MDYCFSNQNCKCYWPEVSDDAKKINDIAYKLFKHLFSSTELSQLVDDNDEQKIFFINIPEYGFNIHGVTINFVCHSFFYSHYRHICQELDWYSKTHFTLREQHTIKNKIYDIQEQLYPLFLNLYNSCLEKHFNERILWEKWLIEAEIGNFHLNDPNSKSLTTFKTAYSLQPILIDHLISCLQGFDEPTTTLPKAFKHIKDTIDEKNQKSPTDRNLDDGSSKQSRRIDKNVQSLDSVQSLLDICNKGCINAVDSEIQLMKGTFYSEALLYNLALESLNESIRLNSKNITAYQERALVYFELGKTDLAISDYQSAKALVVTPSFYSPKTIDDIVYCSLYLEAEKSLFITQTTDFSTGLLKGTLQGSGESAVEFIPSTLSSLKGISQGLWAFACSPKEVSSEIIECSIACIEFIRKNTCMGIMEEVVPEMKVLCHKWDDLTDHDRGLYIGFIIGKYGVEIFTPVAGMKAFKVYRDLKRANSMLTLERCVVSQVNKEAILASTLKHAAERDAYLKNVKIHWDRQNKHIPGAHNFQVGKGKITLDPKELEILLKSNVGKGQRVVGQFGEHGYKERVDFGKIIGEYANRVEGKPTTYSSTTKGIISYAKDGTIHVYPANP